MKIILGCSFTFRISQIAPTNEYTSSILSIKQIKNDLYGAYYCVASNQFGNAEASIHLYGKYYFSKSHL